MDQAERIESKLIEICENFGPFAPGWHAQKLMLRVYEIHRWHLFNTASGIPAAQRKQITKNANALLKSLDGLGGLHPEFIETLRVLADKAADHSGRGGDRRSGERKFESSLVGMIVKLYCEAHRKPGCSENGPLYRFANDIIELLQAEPFKPSAVKNEFNQGGHRKKRIWKDSLYPHVFKDYKS